MQLDPVGLDTEHLKLQQRVRAWLADRLPVGSYDVGLGVGCAADPEFSRDLADQGWVGMTLPAQHGGGGRTQVERLIVCEELLARGAPLGYHWVADRQSGPQIARVGSEEQKEYFLPKIARAELSFAIGMSEPDAGSDLAGLRSTAVRDGEGWRVNGEKIWTSWAMTATHILGLFRTSEDRHAGLTQFIVDRNSKGLTVSPIQFLDGSSEFCQVTFEDVFVPDSRRLGPVGGGWSQNLGELALERGGADRWMSAMPLLELWSDRHRGKTEQTAAELADLGSIAARLWAFHHMSVAVAGMVDQGNSPVLEAALVKEMGTRFEQECVEIVSNHVAKPLDLASDDVFDALLARAVLTEPAWTIRGGTNEILRSVIAKGISNGE